MNKLVLRSLSSSKIEVIVKRKFLPAKVPTHTYRHSIPALNTNCEEFMIYPNMVLCTLGISESRNSWCRKDTRPTLCPEAGQSLLIRDKDLPLGCVSKRRVFTNGAPSLFLCLAHSPQIIGFFVLVNLSCCQFNS